MRLRFLILALCAAVLAPAGAARAQERPSNAPFATVEGGGGWLFTPSLGLSSVWDDNVLTQGKGDNTRADQVSVLAPHAALGFTSPRTMFAASYDGAFEAYRQLDSLNNYGQFESVIGKYQTTKRTTVYLQQQFAVTPTTELPAVVGVPFLRMGAKVSDVQGGVQHIFTKRTSLDASYDFQWLAFDKDPVLGRVLIGGHGHTGSATMRHQLTTTTTAIADYEVKHAILLDGGTFTVQTARAGAERKFSPELSVFAEAGVARVSQSLFEESQTSPSWRVGAARQFQRFGIDATYGRDFIPAFGVGDTVESQDVSAHVKALVSNRVYAEASTDWRRDHPLSARALAAGQAPLRSLWYSGVVGYTASPWLRIEGFLTVTHQTLSRPGGELERNRAGIQVTTTKPMRVR